MYYVTTLITLFLRHVTLRDVAYRLHYVAFSCITGYLFILRYVVTRRYIATYYMTLLSNILQFVLVDFFYITLYDINRNTLHFIVFCITDYFTLQCIISPTHTHTSSRSYLTDARDAADDESDPMRCLAAMLFSALAVLETVDAAVDIRACHFRYLC